MSLIFYLIRHARRVHRCPDPDIDRGDRRKVGVVSVVTTATPTPPTILPIFGPGGSIVGYNVTNGGAGNADALIENLGYLASNAELEAAALSARGNRAAAELQTRRANIYRDAQAEAMR